MPAALRHSARLSPLNVPTLPTPTLLQLICNSDRAAGHRLAFPRTSTRVAATNKGAICGNPAVASAG